jgi:uncharacterized protein (UPF0261 family)
MPIYPENTTSIVMIGCFDTKAEIFASLYEELKRLNRKVITINTGIFGSTQLFPVDYENYEVVSLSGQDLSRLAATKNRAQAIEAVTKGAQVLLRQLLTSVGRVSGVIGMGGGGGSYIVLKAMQVVPFGIPKICISTLAAKDVTHLVGIKDIMLIPSVVDVAGKNSILLTLVRQASLAMDAMTKDAGEPPKSKMRVAISMFGNTTPCADVCISLLSEKGFEVFPFHANGSGGRAMEELISGGYFDAVLDLTTTELADEFCGGICSAGADRLSAAAKAGIPQVVVPGCIDMVNFGAPETVPLRYHDRLVHHWSPDVTLMRTNFTENMELGNQLAERVLASEGPVAVFLPLRGLSEIDREGSPFHNERSNKKLFDTIREKLNGRIPLHELPYHINDYAFAQALVDDLVGKIHASERLKS